MESYDATGPLGSFGCGDAVQIRDGIVHAGEIMGEVSTHSWVRKLGSIVLLMVNLPSVDDLYGKSPFIVNVL